MKLQGKVDANEGGRLPPGWRDSLKWGYLCALYLKIIEGSRFMPARDFDEKGFLSDYVYEHKEEVRKKYAGGFADCECISTQAQKLLLNVDVSDNDTPMLCSLLFFERTIRTAQAAVRLCEIGMVQEAQILVRTAYETAFHASALIADPAIFKKLDAHNNSEDVKQARAMLADVPSDQLSEINKQYLKEIVDTRTGESFSVYSSAKAAGMLNLYSVVYRGLSSLAGHATFRSLDRSFIEDDSGYALYMGPTENQLIFTLSLIAQCLTISIKGLDEIKSKAQ